MLQKLLCKSPRGVDFALPILSKATSGLFRSFRSPGIAPGPPYNFSYPRIDCGGDSRPATEFGFQGFIELSQQGVQAASFGSIPSPMNSLKVGGSTLYPEMEKGAFAADSGISPPVATVWSGLDLAKAGLITNTEAFFQTYKFQQVAQLATFDATFSAGVQGFAFAVSKSRHMGLQLPPAPISTSYSPAFSRFTLLLNPPTDAKYGVRFSTLSGGTETERGTMRPYKLTLLHAGKQTLAQEVTLWPSDAMVIFGNVPDLGEHLKTAQAILLVSGAPSDREGGAEYTVRAGAATVDVDKYITIKSDVMKSLFNDVAHDPKLALAGASKWSYVKSLEAVLKEGRTVPLVAQRASSNDDLLLEKAATLKLVRATAQIEPGEDSETQKIAAAVANSTDEELMASIETLDSACKKGNDIDSARDNLNDLLEMECKDVDESQVMRAILALSALESLDKYRSQALAPMVKRAEPTEESDDEDGEDLAPQEAEEVEEDLCAGL